MAGIGPVGSLILLVLSVLVPIFAGYWVIRLAVRHGVMDTRRRSPEGTSLDRGNGPPLP